MKSFLESLFAGLSEQSLDYCVLRNYELLPESLGGSDLDILVDPDDLQKIEAEVVRLAERYGGSVISKYSTVGSYLKILGRYEGCWWGVAIDLMPGIDYKGVLYVEAGDVLKRAREHKGIKIASEADAAAMSVLKELVNNSEVSDEYLEDWRLEYKKDTGSALLLVKKGFGVAGVQAMEGLLALDRTEAEGRKAAESLRTILKKKAGFSGRLQSFVNVLQRFERLLKRPGYVVAVTGTDGAGKTTVIEGITPVLNVALHKGVVYRHLRPDWLPPLGNATGKQREGPKVVTDPHGKSPSGILLSLVRLSYYWVDYTIGYWRKVAPKVFSKSKLFIFDRYFYDVIVDPKRMRIKLPGFVIRFFFVFVPKPDLLLCLGGDAETLYRRKPETSLEEVSRQVETLRGLTERTSNAVWIDTGGDVQQTLDDVLSVIQRAMGKRFK